ncbi:hypothetical protein ACFL3H_01510 [Gemmatimonadota bacterium]
MEQSPNRQPDPLLLPFLRKAVTDQSNLAPLEELGFADLPEVARNLSRLGNGRAAGFWFEHTESLREGLSGAPDPDLALSALQRLDEYIGLSDLLTDREKVLTTLRILGSSPFLGELLLRSPDSLPWLLEPGGCDRNAVEAIADLDTASCGDEFNEKTLISLNRLKRRQLLRIGSRAALGLSEVEEEWRALSDIADLILQGLLDLIWPDDLPMPSVIAVGKLGGRELNFSSDIDLIFTLSPGIGNEPAQIIPPLTRAIETCVEALTRYTPEGSLYRVDLRLRPGGDRAPLVRSQKWMESYYAGQGAPWERQMLVKARPCAGDLNSGSRFLELLVPFIYPTHATRDPGEEAHRLRRERRAREGPSLPAEHVKLAPGAIRDIEFIVQVFQLLYGGRHGVIRHPSTRESIHLLREEGLLPGSEADHLDEAYCFFRRLETILQMQEDRQTFTLPEGSRRRRAIARLMGFTKSDSFLSGYHSRRGSVLEVLNSLLPGAGEEVTGEPVESILNLPAGGDEAAGRLEQRGFREPAQSHRVLVATGSLIRAGGSNSWAAFVGLLPPLLKDAVATGDPDRALNNLERILRRLGSPGAYVRLLAREESIRRAMLLLCASGDLLTDLILRHPEHFERLFSIGAAGFASDRASWVSQLRMVRARAGSSREMVRELESIRTREFLAAGLSYIAGERDLSLTMSTLGLLARDLVRCFMGVHFREFLDPPQVAVLSLGTLSARSMTFASDADLLFLHREGVGAEVQELAARAGALLSPPGGPYPVDMRLRPEGRSAPTSVDPAYLERYLNERASLWEYLALRRVQPLYGRRSLLNESIEIIDMWLAGFHIDRDARSSLRSVRQMQEEEVRREHQAVSRDELFDVKRSPGAMADIEYLTLGLTSGRRAGPGPVSAHIPDLIGPLVVSGTFTASEGDLLRNTWQGLRSIQVALQLHFGRDITRIPTSWYEDTPTVVISEETMRTLPEMTGKVRALFDREFPLTDHP